MPNAPSPYPLIRNMRTYVSGRVDTRSGLALISAAGTDPVHSIKRLNNDIPSLAVQNARIVGAGPRLYAQVSLAGALVLKDTGYSGNPLSMLQMRPPNSPEAWAYIADSFKMTKIRADGTVFQMGIAPPLNPPSVTLGPDARQIIEKFSSVGAWTNGGTAGAITTGTRLLATTVVKAFYDSSFLGLAPTGQCSMVLNGNISPVRPGTILSFTSAPAEDVIVQNVYPGFTATATSFVNNSGLNKIWNVHLGNVNLSPTNYGYDRGMDDPSQGGIRTSPGPTGVGIHLFSIVQVSAAFPTGSMFGLITGINRGPDGSVSVSINFQGGGIPFQVPTFSTIVGLPTIRCFTLNQRVLGDAVTANDFSLQATIGTGFIQELIPFDLSHVTTISGIPLPRPVQDDDTIHISILMDHPEFLTEGRILFDIDPSTNDFQHNYFFKAFRQSDLQQAVLSNQTVLGGRQGALNTGVVDGFGGRGQSPAFEIRRVGPITQSGGVRSGPVRLPLSGKLPIDFGPGGIVPVSDQAATGTSQWTELSFTVKDLTRVGAALDRTLANVAAIRIQFTVTSTTNIQVSSLWVGGSYGPDIGTTGSPYFYRHRPRSIKTGARGNPSPAILNGIEAHRQALLIAMPVHPDPQTDVLDVFRWGGSLTAWVYVGSAQNTGNPQVIDVFQDLDIASAEQLEFDNFQPFPTIDTPKSGVCNVIGNQVSWVSGDQFNLNWAQGATININGTNYTLYLQPNSATLMTILENGGTQANVPLSIKQPTILAQALPAMWGPFSQNSALFCFACGDQYQPGVLFLTKGNNADSAPDILQIEITSPSEPLMNGCIHNGQPFVWSSKRFFILYPIAQGGFLLQGGEVVPVSGTNIFTPQDISGAKGLLARWFFCAGPGIPRIWYGAEDGIYETSGTMPDSITDEMLYLLFPHDGQPAQPVTLGSDTIQPPDFTQASKLRLSYADGFLYFDYVDINGLPTTLVYNVLTKVWSLDVYSLGTGNGVLTHYLEEGRGVHSLLAGGSDANLYQMAGSTDNNSTFIVKVKMPNGPDSATYQHIRDCYLGLIAGGAVGPTLVVNIDGTDNTFVLPVTGGNYQKIYQVLAALKGKLFSWGITNEFEANPAPFTLFRQDTVVRTKEWGSDSYKPTNPFADFGKRSRIQPGV